MTHFRKQEKPCVRREKGEPQISLLSRTSVASRLDTKSTQDYPVGPWTEEPSFKPLQPAPQL